MTPSLFSAEGLAGLVFYGFVAATLGGAVVATQARQLVRSVAGLALCFVGVAGLYYYLGSPFIAMMQLLIYVGAVCVTIVFAVMLADPNEPPRSVSGAIRLLGAVACAGAYLALAALALSTDWKPIPGDGNGSVERIGQSLLTTNGFSFELISLVLLVAIIGSLVLAREGRSKS